MKHARAAVAILLLVAACKPERREEFAKRLTEIIRRVEPSAQAEVRGDSALLIHSLSDSCAGFSKLVLKGQIRGARELSPSELREAGFTRVECKRTDGTVVSVELSKLDLAYDTVRKYALEAYPSWVAYSGKLCPEKLEVLNEYLSSKDIYDPWGGTYRMRCDANLPTDAKGFEVMSPGADRKEGTEDDVISWE